jgi:hypothetical protein
MGTGGTRIMRAFALTTSIIAFVAMAGCAAGTNPLVGTGGDEGSVAGFWKGLWHGFILLFTFIISLFSDSVHVYEVHNSGSWYDFGFLLGAMIFFGGGSGGAGRRSRRC